MRFNDLRSILLAGTASGALLIASPGQAQNYTTGPGFFLSLEGRYLMGRGDEIVGFDDAVYPGLLVPGLKLRADQGWGGKAMLGYRFAGNWDVGMGFVGNFLKGRDHGTVTGVPTSLGVRSEFRQRKIKLSYQVVDFEAGYNWGGTASNVRLFGGLRAAHFSQNAHAVSSTVIVPLGTATFNSRRKTSFLGVGPRLGVNGQVGLGVGGFNMFGGLSGAILAGKFKDRHTVISNGVTYAYHDRNKTKFAPNLEGELGLGYTFASGGTTLGLQLGYRAEKWWGVSSDAPIYDFTGASHASDQLVHGPFVRLVASFGAARPTPAPDKINPPIDSVVRSFIVFFDFDKSTITAEAQKTIDTAIDAAKIFARNTSITRITLTAHADRSGSEQYNQALSLRRGEAVKAALIRGGIPASAIVVIGRGETQPLVPTADGVREPQNRRVEIVI